MNITKAIATVFLLILVTLGMLPGCALAVDKSTGLSIMTYNAEFLWDGREPEEGSSTVKFSWKDQPLAADAHMKQIASVIIRNNPDIVNLVEVENFNALKYFNETFLAGQGYQPYLIPGKDTATGQDVALLTRIQPTVFARDDRQGKSGKVEKSVAKNYYAKFDFQGQKLALVGIHLLANPSNKSRKNLRQAQGDAVRQISLELRKDGYLPIVLGDFNDYDGEIKDRNDSEPITNVLLQIKTLNTKPTSDDLMNVMQLVKKGDRYTNYYDRNRDGKIQPDREYSAIDFILLPQELSNNISSVKIDHSYDPRKVSDHFPVMVKLSDFR